MAGMDDYGSVDAAINGWNHAVDNCCLAHTNLKALRDEAQINVVRTYGAQFEVQESNSEFTERAEFSEDSAELWR